MRRTDRYIQFALVCAAPGARQRRAARPPRRRARRPAPGVIVGSGLGGVSTLFDNVLRDGRAGPGPDLAVLHPDGHRERRARARSPSPAGALGPNFATVSACASGGHAPGRGLGDDPPRRRGHDDRGRRRGRHPRGGGRRLRVDEGAVHPQRRPGGRLAAVRPGPRRLRRSGEGGGDPGPRGAGACRGARRRRRWRSSSATAPPPTRRTSRCRRPAASVPSRAARAGAGEGGPGARRDRPRQRPRDVHARGRQGGAAGDPDDLRRPRAEGRGDAPTSRCSGTRSARPARSRRSPRSWRCARAACRRRSTCDDPDDHAAGLDLTPNVATRRPLRAAISNSFGFGGQNTALVFRRWDG